MGVTATDVRNAWPTGRENWDELDDKQRVLLEMRGRLFDEAGNAVAMGGGGSVSTSVPSITYNAAGLITSYVSGGVTHTVGYDSQNRVITDSYGGTVETVTYGVNGLVASFVVTGGAAGEDVTAVTYTNGQITGATIGGVASTLVYDAQGRVSTYNDGTVTRTATYNPDGTLASYV